MYEGLNPGDEFDFDEDFGETVEHTVPSARIPIKYAGLELELTPANTAVRLFKPDKADYSRVLVYLDDDTVAPIKPADEFLRSLVHSGFPVELPRELDETDEEFMDEYMRIWTEDANAELADLG